MYRALREHPAVLRPLHKEVHYFDVGYQHNLRWYQSHFPLRLTLRRIERAIGMPPVTFEASPYYMFHPLAPARIARDLPGIRVLVLVRDPVARAYSAHVHEVTLGFETETFERALELEDDRLEGELDRMMNNPEYISRAHYRHAYRTRGQYVEQLDRLAKVFQPANIHVVDSGDFFAEPEPIYDAVLDFLGLPHYGYPVFTRQNARAAAPMPNSLQSSLSEHFLPYDARLSAWLGNEPSWRRRRVSS